MQLKMNYQKVFVFVLVAIMALNVVAAESLERQAPSSVEPGQTFTITYQTVDAPSGKWFLIFSESITGGCTPAEQEQFLIATNGGDKSEVLTYNAPASGECTFVGYYNYANGVQTSLPTLVIPIQSDTDGGTNDTSNGDDGDDGTDNGTDDGSSDTGGETTNQWCNIAEKVAFFDFMKDECQSGTIIIIGGLILLIIIIK